ncbi:MAG: twin-arginine translocase TatA/TatE family subunit [Anaerolineaceae bacterium]|nr:twin-arginine translocase TatA/TatE family subunit [Anaerolineaceae bacterium]
MWRPGLLEILIVLVVILLLFGPGRISKIAKELGASISAFKEGLNGEKDENKPDQAAETEKKEEE